MLCKFKLPERGTMKPILYILIFLSLTGLNGQTFTVVDSTSQKPLEFVTILFKNDGMYSDENGRFELPDSTIKEVTITCIGYEDFIFKSTGKDEIILLKPKEIELAEVVIDSGSKTEEIPFSKKPKNFPHFPLLETNELILQIIPDTDNSFRHIHSIKFSFDRNKTISKAIDPEAIIRVNVYDFVMNPVYSSSSIRLNPNKNEIISIDFKEDIFLPESGIHFGIEVILILPEASKITLNAVLTDKPIPGFSTRTFFRYVFENKKEIIPLNQMLLEMNPGRNIERNTNTSIFISE